MKVIELRAQNLKRLKAVEIRPDPDGNVVVVSGRNGQGKTSVLDAIWFALAGGAATRDTAQPIREGEKRAVVELDLGDFTIKRTWDNDGSKVTVTGKDGAKQQPPQKFLDEKLGALSFDPLAFAAMASKDQRRLLLEVVDTDVDIDEIDKKRATLFDGRTEESRHLRSLEGKLASLPEVAPETPDEEISAATIIAAQEAFRDAVNDRERARDAIRRARGEIDVLRSRITDLEEIIEHSTPAAHAEIMEIPNAEEQLAEIEATNAQVRLKKERSLTLEAVREQQRVVDGFTAQIADLDATKQAAIESADLPIEGLAFDEDGVTYQGIPFKQCSGAEQLRVSLAMAMALNPTVRIIRVADGSLLDSANMAIIEEMAKDQDFQIWVERVDETGTVGFTIEDGEVVA